jgi:hypothetical protein
MSNSVNKTLRDMARMEDDFFGRLAALAPALQGLVPDDRNYTGDSYDELFVVLTAAYYMVLDPELRRRNADRNGGNPKLAAVLLNEGPKDKDAVLVGQVLDRLAAYVHPLDFIDSLIKAHASDELKFKEFRTVFERMTADLWRIASGFEPAKKCPPALVTWASGPHLPLLRKILFNL